MINDSKWHELCRQFNDIAIGRITRQRFDKLVSSDYQAVPFGPTELVDQQSIDTLLQGCESIIVIGVPTALEDGNVREGTVGISPHARWSDYHNTVRNKLDAIADFLGIEDRYISVDTGPFLDRRVAVLAGLGFIGVNDSLINERFGTTLQLGLLLTTEILESDNVINQGECLKCMKCVEACPGRAISENGIIVEQCASYLTQKKGHLTEGEQKIIKGRLYGCDICQSVCPHNQDAKIIPSHESAVPSKEILDLSNKTFRNTYGNSGFSWRGLTTMKRNVLYTIKQENDEEMKGYVRKLTFSQKLLQKIQEDL